MLDTYLLILAGYIFSRGFFSLGSITLLVVSYFFFLMAVVRGRLSQEIGVLNIRQVVFLSTILTAVLYGGLYQNTAAVLVLLSYFLLGGAVVLSWSFTRQEKTASWQKVGYGLLAIALFLRLFMIWTSPKPTIDVFEFLRNGVYDLASGKNPYSSVYPDIYPGRVFDYYNYLPGSILVTAPFVLLMNDPRYALVVAEVLTAFLVGKLSGRGEKGIMLAVTFLYNPMALYLLEQSYVEPLIVFWLTLTAWLVAKKKFWLAGMAFGISLSIKQHVSLVLPLVFGLVSTFFGKARFVFVAVALAVASLVVAPLALWNAKDFLHDVLFVLIELPPRYDALNVPSLFLRLGVGLDSYLWGGAVLFSLFWIYRQKTNSLARFFYFSSLTFFSFFLFNKWAFLNYYYLVSQLFLLGVVFGESRET